MARNGGGLLGEWGDAVPSPLARALEERHRYGDSLTDLITANPQEEGFEFPPDLLQDIMTQAARDARRYRPDPRGQLCAREAVARYHGTRTLSPDQVILTPGTSLGYFYAFRLLADPGEEVLVPSPTYPLFDDLARLAGLGVRRYHLHRDDAQRRWTIDPDEVEFQITSRTRIIAVVSPHNPTGAVASANELRSLADIARRHRLAIVFDEVFREFLHGDGVVSRPADFGAPLVVTLNGLSKMLSLPGMKGGWMAAEGEDVPWRERFLAAAEYLSDTFLPVSELTQAALPRLLDEGADHVRFSAELCRRRMGELVREWQGLGVEVRHPEAGPYLTIPMAASLTGADEEELVLRLLRDEGILVHPGGLYSMPPGHLVTTCIRRPPWPLQAIAEAMRIWPDREGSGMLMQ